eukprot:9372497-Alexandrium_andersonii.AAC.1
MSPATGSRSGAHPQLREPFGHYASTRVRPSPRPRPPRRLREYPLAGLADALREYLFPRFALLATAFRDDLLEYFPAVASHLYGLDDDLGNASSPASPMPPGSTSARGPLRLRPPALRARPRLRPPPAVLPRT